MTSSRITALSLLAITGVLAIWDVYLLNNDQPNDTISSVIMRQTWIHGIIGFGTAHIVRKTARTNPWWVIGLGATLAIVTSVLVGGGILGLLIGVTLGAFLWTNSGTT